ncbi:MAG TPA: hypothetical protein VFE65_32630 [Pseudonocardia sp.]|nr:hypothetical protein [Pseudonocardia sp.]
MTAPDDILGGFVLDASALEQLAGANIYATTWADRAAVRGIVLLIPAAALSEAWQRAVDADPDSSELLRELLSSPMVVIEPLDELAAAATGELFIGLHLPPDISAAQVVISARDRDWPVLAAEPSRLLAIEPHLDVETLPGT